MTFAKNPTNYERSKHIDVQHNFIRFFDFLVVEFEYCPTQCIVAEILTKALAKNIHELLS